MGSESLIDEENITPSAPEVDLPPDPAGAPLVRGRAFKVKVRRLLQAGVTEPSTRHDAVLTLVFYWGATCGLAGQQVLARLEAWCRAHAHSGSRLNARAFLATCLREGRHYFEHYSRLWPFRGRGDGGGLGTLTTADAPVLAVIDPRVRDEVAAVLAWLAGRADADGRIGTPVQIATGLLTRLCGDRRVVEDGKRRRATAIALAELERIGLLTMAHNYRVGHQGRTWSCWYRFGSGLLPRAVELPAAEWAALETSVSVALVPTLAIAPLPEPRQDGGSAPIVEVRVVGERVVPEGLLRVLSDGARGKPRTLLTLAPDVARPTVAPASREPWFVRAWNRRAFTPGELWAVDPAMVIPFADIEARRRMTRRERLVWGGGVAPVIPLRPVEPAPVEPAPVEPSPVEPSPVEPSPVEPVLGELRVELALEVGAAAAEALQLDLVDVLAHAWRSWRGRPR